MSKGNNIKKVIGIDLGTTFSCIATRQKNGNTDIIFNQDGQRTTPSVVYFGQDETLVGTQAVRKAPMKPEDTIFSAKSFLGNVTPKNIDQFAFNTSTKDGKIHFKLSNGKEIRPEQVSAEVLRYLGQQAAELLGCSMSEIGAVVTVPAYFNDQQRSATKNAGEIAGLNIMRIINEPTAAAIAYGIDKADLDQKIIVYDLGGGTFDVSVLEISEGTFEVLSTNGNSNLGGDNFDHKLLKHVLSYINKNYQVDLSDNKTVVSRLTEEVKNAKKNLSSQNSVNLNIPFLYMGNGKEVHLDMSITRSEFENLISEFYDDLMSPCKVALKDAGLTVSDIDKVLLVGGSTRIPKVVELVKNFFGKDPEKSINPDEAVAMGAAIQAAVLRGDVKDVLLLDVTPLSLGIETMGGVMTKIIEKNTTIPTKKSQVFSTAEDNQNAVSIKVYQGERPMAADNKLLGNFDLVGIPPAPKGQPQIEVSFELDANGILNVTALEKKSGKEQKVTIKDSAGLSDEEIERMKADAEANAEADSKKKEMAEETNKAQNMVFQAEKMISDRKDLTDEQTQPIKDGIESLKKTIEEKSIEGMKAEVKTLLELLSKLPAEPKSEEKSEEAKAENAQ